MWLLGDDEEGKTNSCLVDDLFQAGWASSRRPATSVHIFFPVGMRIEISNSKEKVGEMEAYLEK
jgi:hypothetical protein